MAIFGFGGSSAKSQGTSESSSLDYGANVSESFSDSLARSLAQSQGSSFGTQNVWNADVLQKLYAGATDAAGAANTGLFQGQTAQLYNAGAGFLDQLGVGAGEDYLQSRLTDTTARDEQLGALKTGLGDLFRNELNPAITGRAVATGTLGGGRQGVAQGQAANAVARQYSQGAADIIGRDQLARDNAAGTLGALSTARASAGIAGLSPMLEAAQAGLGAPLSPYAALSQIIGGPTVLTQQGSQDTSYSTSEQIAQAISQAMGFNYGTSQSQSQNTSKAKSFNFGLG
jgi:hypothetical protein